MLVLTVGFAVLAAGIIRGGVVLADTPGDGLGNTSPATDSGRRYSGDPGSGYMSAGSQATPYLDVGNNNQDYTYSLVQTRVYVKSGGNVAISIDNGYSDCHSSSGGGVVGPDYNQNGINPTTQFTLVGVSGNIWTITKTNGGCGPVDFPAISANNAFPITPTPYGSSNPDFDGYFLVEAQITKLSQGEGENSYRVVTSSGGLVGDGNTTYGLGDRTGDLTSPGNYWAGWTTFALPFTCSNLNTPITKKGEVIKFFDTDSVSQKTTWNADMIYVLQEQQINSDGTPNGGWSPIQTLKQQSGQIPDPNGSFSPFNAASNYRYRVILANVGVRNTVRIQIPSDFSTLYSDLNERPTTNSCQTNKTFSYSCSTNPANLGGLLPGQNVTIKVATKNTGSATWNPNTTPLISMHKVSNGTPQGSIALSKSSTGGKNVLSGGSTVFTFAATAPASGTSKTLVFTLYRGSSPMSGTTCKTVLTSKSGTPPNYWGIITTSCTTTTIQIHTAASDWYYVYSPSGNYFTTTAPEASPYWTSKPSPATPPAGATPGSDYTDPLTGVPYYWYGQTRTVKTEDPASEIPYYVQFYDDSGNPVGGQQKGVLNASGGTGQTSFSTFNTYGFLWPHNAYSASLYGEVTGNFEKGGPYGNYIVLDGSDLTQCLHATASAACVGPNSDPGPVEPGQNFNFTYAIQLINNTDKTFSASSAGGYSIKVYTDGGLVYLASYPASASPISPGTVNINVSIPVRVDYTGDFGVTFEFQGQQLPIDDWPGDCGTPGSPGTPVGTDTPATRPYFQVWNGDAATGGGFMNIDGTCNTSSPSYISPPTTGNQYSGGIRAFADQSSRRGSLTDFGAIALGLIQGTSGGPVGFYSSHNIYFANSGVPGGNMGGYLNSNSVAHCVPDYFTNTRIDPNPPGVNGSSWDTSPSGQYTLSGNTLDGGSISAGQQITIYVDGNVTIDGNITYPSTFDPNDISDIPYFTLIARGNIYVTHNVSRLDGLYVAQPNGSGSGIFSTCNGTCNGQLVVNGAVIAQQVQPLRSHGTLGPLDKDDDGIGTNPAEIFNYVPSMVIGNPYFAPEYNAPESIFSLPPVF